MPLIQYQDINFTAKSLAVIEKANSIIQEYMQDGYDLTLRQLYYQFVSRGWIENRQSEYKRLGGIVNDARMAGRIDWGCITDRTRNLRQLPSWDTPQQIVQACSNQFRYDIWKTQPNYVEVWIEKDALVGVIERVCNEYSLPYFSCRGYTSQSEMWEAAQRLRKHRASGKGVHILHLGDHDPSGKDMTRDIFERLNKFVGLDLHREDGWSKQELEKQLKADKLITVNRLALNMDQIEEYNPPPNPAKMTDSRADDYVREFGMESWELDALDPRTIGSLIRKAVDELIDEEEFDRVRANELNARKSIKTAANNLPKRTVEDNWTDKDEDD